MRMEPWQEVNEASLHTHGWDRALPESLGLALGFTACSKEAVLFQSYLESVIFWVLMLQQCHRVRHQ